MTDHRRLFFALWPPPAVREALRAQAAPVLAGRSGRRVHPADFHATLAYLGATGSQPASCAMQAAAGIHWQGFELVLDQLGYWKRPRVIWAGARQTPAALTALAGKLQQRLIRCGFEPEARPFRLHLTLARRARGLPQTPLAPPVVWPVQGFVLAESVREPQSAQRYRVVKSWPPGS